MEGRRRSAGWCTVAAVLFAAVSFGTGSLLAATRSTVVGEDAAEIRRVFEAYRTALASGAGQEAAALVDEDTFSYFEQLKRLALEGGEDAVRSRPFVDRLLVVSMRQAVSRSELEGLELGGLMNKALSEGWISPQTVAQLDIGEVEVDGDFATATAVSLNPMVSFEEGDPMLYEFKREQGRWRFAFSSLVASLNRLVEEFTAELGTDQDDLIFLLVQNLTGRPVLPEVWQQPGGGSPP